MSTATAIQFVNTYNRPDNLIEYIAWLTTKLESIPSEYRKSACVDISGSDWGVEYTISYEREKTAAERAEDDKKAEAYARQRLHDIENEIAILKAKYPNNL